MTGLDKIRAQRSLERQNALSKLCDKIAQRAAREGVSMRLFGSFARGRVTPDSDLDILVTGGYTPATRFSVMGWMQDIGAEHDLPVDVAFLDMAPHLEAESVPLTAPDEPCYGTPRSGQ